MNDRLSLRARAFGAVCELLLKPVLSMPAARMRPRLDLIGAAIARVPRGMRIEATSLGGVSTTCFTPRELKTRGSAILYLHGGAYLGGSPRSHRGLLAQLAQASSRRVFAPDYRLAPEHPCPAPREDAVAAYEALLAQNIAPAGIVIVGDSAGGNLVLVSAIALRDAGRPLPASLVLLSPWTDLTSSGESMRTCASRERILTTAGIASAAAQYAGSKALDDPEVSPLFADLRGLPPMLIQVGGDEVLLDDSTRLAYVATRAGVEVSLQIRPGLWHVWQAMAGWIPEADVALRDVAAFIGKAA